MLHTMWADIFLVVSQYARSPVQHFPPRLMHLDIRTDGQHGQLWLYWSMDDQKAQLGISVSFRIIIHRGSEVV